MASADFMEELNCSICLNVYTDPVSLKCHHNFCRVCIEMDLDARKGSGLYTCPECRAEYPERPLLEINRKLRNIVESFLLISHKDPEKIFCTYCIKSPVPAVKTCLHCEISLCDDHLEAHNTKVDHVLVEPISSFGAKKCSIHKKALEFYCPEDEACLCTSCCLVGKHQGHQVVLLEEAAERKKEKLKKLLDKVTPKKKNIEKQLQGLQDCKREVQENASKEKQRATNLFSDISKQLEVQKKQVLSDISRREESVLLSASNVIQELESQKDKLSTKMSLIEELRSIADPITLLQEQLSDMDDAWDLQDEEANKASIPNLDRSLTSLTIHKSITDFIKDVCSTVGTHIREASNILLDTHTAHVNVAVSPDLKTASFSATLQVKSELSVRFRDWSQVLSSKTLCGQHFWEIEISSSGACEVGVCYPSMGRQGEGSSIGDNSKSWSLRLATRSYVAMHDSRQQRFPLKSSCRRFGVFLDYGSGHLSFYQLCNPIQHIHTFSTIFTEPLYAAFAVNDGAWVTIKG